MSGTTVTGSELRRRIRIEQLSTSSGAATRYVPRAFGSTILSSSARDAAGGMIASWVVVADHVPAKIDYPPPSRKGDETYSQNQVHTALFVSITIRHRPSANISPAMRIVYGNRIFTIRTVVPISEERRYIQLQCEEIYAKGSLH